MRPLDSAFNTLTLNISEFALFKYVFSSSFSDSFPYFEIINGVLCDRLTVYLCKTVKLSL
jgi:hypothetical protein